MKNSKEYDLYWKIVYEYVPFVTNMYSDLQQIWKTLLVFFVDFYISFNDCWKFYSSFDIILVCKLQFLFSDHDWFDKHFRMELLDPGYKQALISTFTVQRIFLYEIDVQQMTININKHHMRKTCTDISPYFYLEISNIVLEIE